MIKTKYPSHEPEYRKQYQQDNKEKIKATWKVWYEQNKEARSAYSRKYNHGTDGKDLWDQQEGLCGICQVDLTTLPKKSAHLDHCHETKKIRGWLCQRCNNGLGLYNDDPALLMAAAGYLKDRDD